MLNEQTAPGVGPSGIDITYKRLSDMAADTVGLLDALDLEAAHMVGVSLGGAIAQTIAIEHPGRILSLTSMMSTSHSRRGAGAHRGAETRSSARPV